MDWLSDPISDFGWWLLTSPTWGLLVGAALIWGGIFAIAYVLVSRYGDVKIGPDPTPPEPLRQVTETIYEWAVEPAPNYHREDLFPLADEMVQQMDELADAITDALPVIDPLADYQVTEVIDWSTPLFYEIRRRPRAYELETFTTGWNREALQERIKEAMK